MPKINGQNRKDYSATELIAGNLAIILWITIGALACALFYPLSAILFFAVTAFLVFYEIGKHGCVTCYYCKNCTIGMGKLPELFFRLSGTANVNRRALRIFSVTYMILTVVPTILIVISLLQTITIYKIGLLIAILAFSINTAAIRRRSLYRSIGKN
jgi:hypothetical protein